MKRSSYIHVAFIKKLNPNKAVYLAVCDELFGEGGVLEKTFPRAIPKLLPLRGGLLYTSNGYVVFNLCIILS